MVKRGQFIGKLHSFRQEYGNLDPLVYIQLVSTYISSFYGSNLWDLYGEDSDKLYKSWNIMIRIIFNLPRETHKYLIEPISYKPHLKVQLVKRFISFCNSLKASDKPHLKYLMNLQMTDYRSTFGRNVVNICKDGGVDKISEVQPQNIIYAPVSPDDSWRIPLIQELLEVRAQRLQTILDPEEVLDLLRVRDTKNGATSEPYISYLHHFYMVRLQILNNFRKKYFFSKKWPAQVATGC